MRARTAGGAATPASVEPVASAAAPASDSTTFLSVVDGDTIQTSAGTVRIIGIDTPNEVSAATRKRRLR
jgi:hypothetical protein